MQESRPVVELIVPRWIVPIEPAGVVLEGHAIAIDSDGEGSLRSVRPLRLRELRRTHGAAIETDARRTMSSSPGMVNLHTHAAMTLLRGLGDDLPLMDWLQHAHLARRRKHCCPRTSSPPARASPASRCCAEGTTTFSDMYFFPDAAGAAAVELGMRAHIGLTVIDFPTAGGGDADDYLDRGVALFDRMQERTAVDVRVRSARALHDQ